MKERKKEVEIKNKRTNERMKERTKRLNIENEKKERTKEKIKQNLL